MSFEKGNKQKIRHQALLEAIRICGGVTAYSRCLKVSRSRASNWCNRPELEIPYEYAVLTEHITQVSIERLSPFTESANKIFRQLRMHYKPQTLMLEVDKILIKEYPYLRQLKQDGQILVGTDGVLISGLRQIENHKALGIQKTSVMVLDLESLSLGKRTIQDMNVNLLISEQVAIGLRLEYLLGNRQGQRNDLRSGSVKKEAKNDKIFLSVSEIRGRKDVQIAKILGLSRNTYCRAKQVCLLGTIELMDAMDRKEISIAMAAQNINSTKSIEEFRS